MSYYQFKDPETGERYGSFRVFRGEVDLDTGYFWYWQSEFPGCLPDGEANGPFASEQEAINDALGD